MSLNLKALIGRLNDTTRKALEGAAGLCVSRTHYDIEIEHFLLKLLQSEHSDFKLIAEHFNVDRSRIEAGLERALDQLKSGNARSPAFGVSMIEAVSRGWTYGSINHDAMKIRTGFIIVAILESDHLAEHIYQISSEFKKIDKEALELNFTSIVSEEEDEVIPQPKAAPAKQFLNKPPNVFLSYRREDGSVYPGFLSLALSSNIPGIHIFHDTDAITPGTIFSEKIDAAIKDCDVLIAIIGKKWLGGKSRDGTYRIVSKHDWVRREVATALMQNKLVIPCIVDGAKLPREDELPPDLAGLIFRQTINLSIQDPKRDMEALIKLLSNWQRSSS